MNDVISISNDEFDMLRDKWCVSYDVNHLPVPNEIVPWGCYYVEYDDGSCIAADNGNGMFFVEEFSTKENCLLWLNNPDMDAWDIEHNME